MASSKVEVRFSQETLFFPLPFTDAAIENVVQVKNLLPQTHGSPKVNVISFKVLSAVRHRYSVRPAVGFIAAGEALTVNFSMDPEAIRNNSDPTARVLPTESTHDAIYLDFAVVGSGKESELAFLDHWAAAGGTKAANEHADVASDASKFWKAHGGVSANASSGMRKKLPCTFAARDRVPDTLVMSMKADRGGSSNNHSDVAHSGGAGAAPEPPTTRPPSTASTNNRRTGPPDTPPRRYSSQRSTPMASTPRASVHESSRPPISSNTTPNSSVTPRRQQLRNSPSPAPLAPSASSSAATAAAQKPPLSGQGPARASAGSQLSASEHPKAMWKAVANYRIPFNMAAVFVLIALLCGIFETHSFFTWLIAGK